MSWEEDTQIEHIKEGTEAGTSLRASGPTGRRTIKTNIV
jgi:hypothetical protein